jgi:3-hydroxyisobutyrate dehydrogenase-like beta-hydroxyacid dehydrogenase
MSEKFGFIGLGNMGQGMAGNLLKAGFELRVYNRNPKRAEPLVAQGAQQVSHPGEVVEPGGIVVTMVANDDALEQVTLGQDGFLDRLGSHGIHLAMSTISPATARKLADLHTRHGRMYVAAPVFGRPEAAAAQQLWICVSGSQAAKERVRPLLQAMGQGIFDFGEDPGAANVVKLTGNFLVAAALEAMAEALTLAEKNGLDRSQVAEMFGQTAFGGPIYQNYGKAIAQKRYTPAGFYLSLGLKDVGLELQIANDVKMPMPFASLLHDRLLASLAKGRGDMDWSALALDVSEDAGIQ